MRALPASSPILPARGLPLGRAVSVPELKCYEHLPIGDNNNTPNQLLHLQTQYSKNGRRRRRSCLHRTGMPPPLHHLTVQEQLPGFDGNRRLKRNQALAAATLADRERHRKS